MKCQNCGIRPASINVSMQINNEKVQMQLCNQCFEEIQGQMMNSSGFFSGQGQQGFGQSSFQGNGAAQAGTRTQQQQGNSGNGLLDQLGKNVSASARAGMVDKVIGRDTEVKRTIETLNRRNKNNPVLIGEPGVGKTAIAEGLAVRIAEGNVPTKLMNKEVCLLDVASLVA